MHFLVSTLQLNKRVSLVFPSPPSIFLSFFFFSFETRITVIKTRRLRNTWGVLEVAQAGSLLVVTAGDRTQLSKPYCVQLTDSALASPRRQALPDSKFLCITKDW